MILSLLSLGAEVTPAIKESQEAIEEAFRKVFDEKYTFVDFATEKSFLLELERAVAEDSIIVAATSPTYYKAFKDFVCKSFNMKCKANKVIANAIIKAHPEFDDDFVNENASIPQGSTPLTSEDGLFSGFGIKAKKQLLLILPLDDRRIDYIINTSLHPFVRENMDLDILSVNSLDKMKDEKVKGISAPTKRDSGSLYNVATVADAVNELTRNGQTVSFANTKTVDFLKMISNATVDLSQVSFISNYTIEKGDMPARDYAIALAKGALQNSSATFGAALTKVFSQQADAGIQYFMYVSVADSESANVAKLTAYEDETPPQLIYRACEEVFRMLKVCAATGYAATATTTEGRTVTMREKPRAGKNEIKLRNLKIISYASLALTAISSLIITLVA